MRVWDLPVSALCNKHLAAEHHEAHCIYSIITNNKTGFAHHPEVMRWRGRLKALQMRHVNQVAEMQKRGFRHLSPIYSDIDLTGYPDSWEPLELQAEKLKSRCEKCKERLESYHSSEINKDA